MKLFIITFLLFLESKYSSQHFVYERPQLRTQTGAQWTGFMHSSQWDQFLAMQYGTISCSTRPTAEQGPLTNKLHMLRTDSGRNTFRHTHRCTFCHNSLFASPIAKGQTRHNETHCVTKVFCITKLKQACRSMLLLFFFQ